MVLSLYGAMDQDGNLVDSILSQKRDMAAAEAFFTQTQKIADQVPERVITDVHTSYPRAIAEVLGPTVGMSSGLVWLTRLSKTIGASSSYIIPLLDSEPLTRRGTSAKRWMRCGNSSDLTEG